MQERSTYLSRYTFLYNLLCFRICCTKVHKCINTLYMYTRPANLDEVISSVESVARRILYFRTALQGIAVYVVALVIESKRASTLVIIVETAIFTWKRLWHEGTRHPVAASVGTGPRSSDGRPVASIFHSGGARIATTWANRATARQEEERKSPTIFAAIFFATIFSHATVHLIPLPPSR